MQNGIKLPWQNCPDLLFCNYLLNLIIYLFISLCIFVKTCGEAKSWWLTRLDWKTTKQHTHSRPVRERILRVHSHPECVISSYNGLYLHAKWSHGKQCYLLLDFILCWCVVIPVAATPLCCSLLISYWKVLLLPICKDCRHPGVSQVFSTW